MSLNRRNAFVIALALFVSGLIGAPTLAQPAPEKLRAYGTLDMENKGPQVSRYIFGQFTEHLGRGVYDGIWVGPKSSIANVRGIRSDVVAALRDLKVPVVRWPGGCFADEYNWRDGIGPRSKRPIRRNNWWGGSDETNQFGTHEYFDFINQIGADAYVSMNMGSTTPMEMREWIEYMTSDGQDSLAQERRKNGQKDAWKVPFIGIGNEYWGCGGKMTPSQYGREFMRFTAFYHPDPNNPATRVAVGGKNGLVDWTDDVMTEALEKMDAISIHYYTSPTGNVDETHPATGFDEKDWADTYFYTLKMEDYIRRNIEVMDKHDPDKRVALFIDEWGTWYTVENGTNPGHLYQQNTLKDALIAGINFHIFMNHAERVRMTNIAQTINVLQSMILTRGPDIIKTPTYYSYLLHVPFQDATALDLKVAAPDVMMGQRRLNPLSGFAARTKDGQTAISLINMDPNQAIDLSLDLGHSPIKQVHGQILTGETMDAHNEFGQAPQIEPKAFEAATVSPTGVKLTLPPKSLVVLLID